MIYNIFAYRNLSPVTVNVLAKRCWIVVVVRPGTQKNANANAERYESVPTGEFSTNMCAGYYSISVNIYIINIYIYIYKYIYI